MNELTQPKNEMEKPDVVYGRLLESVHISGYSFERVCAESEWMLDQDRWKIAGPGYGDINQFLESIDLSQFKIDPIRRKKLVKKLTDIEATQRAAARMLGVTPMTVSRDLQPVTNVTEPETEDEQNQDVTETIVTNVTEPPKPETVPEEKDKDTIAVKWTGDQESYTPSIYIEAAREVMGSIDLDPASNELAQKTVRAKKYFTKEDNGLDKVWKGNIFLNPPYSHPEIKQFVDKLLTDLIPGQQAILLTNNNTDTNFFHDAARIASSVCFTKGRINFVKNDGSLSSPTNGQVFFYFGKNKAKFIKAFSKFGIIMEKS